mmetsp:Transcript_26637/g.48903  ORF Transcript_26637/g.48903 Transcript_26637/m.48903 type:complete len:243 (-) Transcript_26637:376-1104(-)
MVVVPALTVAEDTDPPVIAGKVAGVVVLVAPAVASAIHEPGDMPDPAKTESTTPDKSRETTEEEEDNERESHVPGIGLPDPPVKRLTGEVLDVLAVAHALQSGVVVEDPAHVAPPETLIWTMGVQRGIGMEVVVAVAAGPLHGVTLNSEDTAVSKGVFEPLGELETAMTKHAMITKGNAQATSNEVHDEEKLDHAPGESKRCKKSKNVHATDEAKDLLVIGIPFTLEEKGAFGSGAKVTEHD